MLEIEKLPGVYPNGFEALRAVDPPGAVRMVTLEAAPAVGLRDRGALAAGQRADLIPVRVVGEVPPAERADARDRLALQFASGEAADRV